MGNDIPNEERFRQIEGAECIEGLAQFAQVPSSFVAGLEDGSDWFFVLRIHALIELSLNRLLISALGDARLADVIARLDTSDKQRGKMAFIKALDLLPKGDRQFISILSQLRNDMAHDVSNFDFSLSKWVSEMPPADLNNLVNSLKWESEPGRTHGDFTQHKPVLRKFPAELVRALIINKSFSITSLAHDQETKNMVEPLQEEAKRLEGLASSYEAGKQPTPKAE